MKRRRDSEKDDTEVLGLANVAAECLAQSKSTSALVSRGWVMYIKPLAPSPEHGKLKFSNS